MKKEIIFFIIVAILVTIGGLYIDNLYISSEVSEKEYSQINRLKHNAESSLASLTSGNKETASLDIYGGAYFSYPLEHEVDVNKSQLNELLGLIEESMSDDIIGQKEFGKIGALLREFVEEETSKRLTSIKNNLSKQTNVDVNE